MGGIAHDLPAQGGRPGFVSGFGQPPGVEEAVGEGPRPGRGGAAARGFGQQVGRGDRTDGSEGIQGGFAQGPVGRGAVAPDLVYGRGEAQVTESFDQGEGRGSCRTGQGGEQGLSGSIGTQRDENPGGRLAEAFVGQEGGRGRHRLVGGDRLEPGQQEGPHFGLRFGFQGGEQGLFEESAILGGARSAGPPGQALQGEAGRGIGPGRLTGRQELAAHVEDPGLPPGQQVGTQGVLLGRGPGRHPGQQCQRFGLGRGWSGRGGRPGTTGCEEKAGSETEKGTERAGEH